MLHSKCLVLLIVMLKKIQNDCCSHLGKSTHNEKIRNLYSIVTFPGLMFLAHGLTLYF